MSKLPDHLREFDDTDKTRELIYSNTLDALKRRFPVEDDDYRLELSDVRYDGKQSFGLQQQKDALMKNRQLRTPVKGRWRLIDKKTKAVLDEREDTIMNVPYYTERGTFIHNGNEYSMVNQSRLKPGAYVRRQRTGDVETQFNVRPGTGKGFRMHLEPNSGIFRVQVGQSKVPAYTLMKTMGVDDKTLMKAWGPELLEANIKAQDKQGVSKLYQRFAGYKADPNLDDAGKMQWLKEHLPTFEMDEDVVGRTLGVQGGKGVTPEVMLRATQKMLGVSRREEDPDDRDHPQFSNVMSVEDFMPERIDKDAGRLARSLLFKARRTKNLKPVQRGALNPYHQGLMAGSGLAMPLEETNPLHTLEQTMRLTKLGLGGIGSAEAITDEARNVNSGQFGFIDPIAGPEGLNIGIDTRLTYRTFKGKDRNMYGEFRNPATGKMEYKTPADVASMAVAFPGAMSKPGNEAVVMKAGRVQKVPKKEVELEVPSMAHMMYSHTNLNPMPTGVQPGRQFYGAKFWSQYMPLVNGEVPLVDSLMEDGKETFSEHYGKRVGTKRSQVAGTVVAVKPTGVTVEDAEGNKHTTELVKDFPFNRITGISYSPSVEVGDAINVGDMVAHSNFTDKKTGGINMGSNLKTAVIPARGKSFEDAYVISESAAKKMSTERLYGYDQEATQGVTIDKNEYISSFPKTFSKDQVEKIGDDGVVKPGEMLEFGDPIILSRGPKLLTHADAQLGKLHKVLRNAHTDKAVTWDHHYPGYVTDVAMTSKGAKVNVKASPPVQVGDKLSTRYGLKGVVGTLIPDDQMPRDPVTNEPYELLMNPMGIQSRVAPNQLVELALAKIAKKTGKQVRLPQMPPEEGWAAWAQGQLESHDLSDSADIFDPETGKTIKHIGDGFLYISPFHHLADKKLSARSEQGSYTIDDQPAKGGSEGAKKFSTMDATATLAHGAPAVLKDALLVRGTKDEEFWKALRMGRPLPEPKTPFIYDKFLNTLKAGGVNISQKGDTLSLLPMTDDDVGKLSKGKIKNSKSINYDFEPVPGGLFDVGATGGMSGNRWTHIDLKEPMSNPVMEEPIRRVLGLTTKKMRDVITGREEINGMTGGAALQGALADIDVDKAIEHHRQRVRQLRGANRDNSVKVLGYLASMKEQGLHPSKWMINKVPVLPPMFRPVARMGDVPLSADMNQLYSELMEVNQSIGDLRKDLPETELAEQKEQLYDAVTAAYGLGESITPEGQSKRIKGAIRQVIGRSPKTGMFQSKVLSKTVGGVGRGVVTPNPNYDMDTVGIPADSAWSLYKDFVTRRLVRKGYPTVRAQEMVEERKPEARAMLDLEMEERPVIMDRAPTWHKFNLMAFHPKIVDGKTIQVSPLIVGGFNMDFDGDQANFHVPVSRKAVSQARERMMPSRNLYALTDLESPQHTPTMEMTMGLYQLTQAQNKKAPKVFPSAKAAKQAYNRGEIGVNDPIVIEEG